MIKMKYISSFLIFLFLGILPSSAFANGEPLTIYGNPGTGNVERLSSADISIESEILNIDLHKGYAEVEVIYEMKNYGSAHSVTMGFPCIATEDENSGAYAYELLDYRLSDNGMDVKWEKTGYHAANKYPLPEIDRVFGMSEGQRQSLGWFSSQISFARGETRIIRITYSSNFFFGAYNLRDANAKNPQLFRYLLSTGASWYGPIKKGTVTISPKSIPMDLISCFPFSSFKKKGASYVWEFRNLDPTPQDDILVDLDNSYEDEMLFTGNSPWVDIDIVGRIGAYWRILKDGTVIVSSTLPPDSYRYDAENLYDGNLETAWVEGASGDGIGEWIRMEFKKPVRISMIGIVPGYMANRKFFLVNNRVSEMDILINGTYYKTVRFSDDYVVNRGFNGYDFIPIHDFPKGVSSIDMVIKKVFKGTKYRDTCVSEIIVLEEIANPREFGPGEGLF